MRIALLVAVPALLAACGAGTPAVTPAAVPPGKPMRSIDDDIGLLASRGEVIVLDAPGGGQIVISPQWQGRVMTSAVAPHAASLGFVHRTFLEQGKTGTAFDNPGGEDRFWLGPEGGQFGLYFPPGAAFAIGAWQVPHEMQEGAWEVTARDATHVTLSRRMHVTNWSGTSFDVAVERTVRALGPAEVQARFGAAPAVGARWVAYETDNRVTNAGSAAWTPQTGLLSIWILGMYAPAPDAHVIVPFDPSASGTIVRDDYFGKVPAERLVVHERQGYLSFTADGQLRGKIGLPPGRARGVLGSYSPGAGQLTLVKTERPATAPNGYVNSLWERQADPYAGDALNSYNDGPTGPGKPSLGGFYEIETSSPALALPPGGSAHHVHATIHVVGDRASLDGLARAALGMPLP